MSHLVLGIVADDFTGASDAASFLVEAGIPTLLYSGIPQNEPPVHQDIAVVIALKSRTAPVQEAVAQSLEAFQWLKDRGAQKLYLKYCSTFDSTQDGNIGPVVDAVLDRWDIPATVLCPALPVNGRRVKEGILYVGDVPLAQSHMKDHPLTPMKDSRLIRLMEQQSKYRAALLSWEDMARWDGPSLCRAHPEIRYWIPDHYEDSHADRIAQVFTHLPFFTGGSGLVGALGRRIHSGEAAPQTVPDGIPGKALILAGSCSKITLAQIDHHIRQGYPALQIHPDLLQSGEQTLLSLWQWVQAQDSGALVYSSAAPEALQTDLQARARQASLIEATFSSLAKLAVANGWNRIIVAGGETSGAVTQGLECSSFSIGSCVAPGVPVMAPLENPSLRLVLKSGNFGQPDFFSRALTLTQSHPTA